MTTGYRAEELANLVPESFALDAEPPTATLPARLTKNKRTATQPLSAEVADVLRDYLRDKPAGRPVWPGTWFDKAAEVLRVDLEAAGIPYALEGPDGPLFADFHALRHSFVALLDKTGATLKEAMQLARHSDPRLTMAIYGRARLHDLGAAVERLPSVLPQSSAADAPAMRATGTDNNPACSRLAQPGDRGQEQAGVGGTAGPEGGQREAPSEPPVLRVVGSSRERAGAGKKETPEVDEVRGRLDSNQRPPEANPRRVLPVKLRLDGDYSPSAPIGQGLSQPCPSSTTSVRMASIHAG
jgi:hypothetical protein